MNVKSTVSSADKFKRSGQLQKMHILSCDYTFFVTIMLLVANSANTKCCKELKMTEPLANGYSFERTQRELSNEYQHVRVYMVFKNLGVLVIWTKVASALEGLDSSEVVVLGCLIILTPTNKTNMYSDDI